MTLAPAATHCKRGCGYEHTPVCVAQREIVYLGQVGAFDHLVEIAERLGVPLPEDVGFEGHSEPTPSQDGRKSAFATYERALETACAAPEGGQFASGDLPRAITHALVSATNRRLLLLRKGHSIPGRQQWLRPAMALEEAA